MAYIFAMRLLPVLATIGLAVLPALATARPLDVHVGLHHRARAPVRIAGYLVRHGLLTPEQAACASFVHGPHGSRRVEQLKIYENTGGRCPGVPQPPTYLFDVFVDRVSGTVDTTPETPDELDTVL